MCHRCLVVLLSMCLSGAHAMGTTSQQVFNIRDWGAKADRAVNDRSAIQAAVDACGRAGGGVVVIPPGEYLSSAIRLTTGVTVRIEEGARLWASANQAAYEGLKARRLFSAQKASGIAVIGRGVIEGPGTADLGERWGVPERPSFRVGVLLFEDCSDVVVRDVTIRNSDSWTLHFKRCDGVVVEGVTIRNNYRRLNSDGIDPDMCRNVRISRCDIVAGDDCIVLKTTGDSPCENVVVTSCVLESAASALKLGTESHGDFRNIQFADCLIRNSPTGLGLYLKDGGTMEDVRFSNIRLETGAGVPRSITPLFVDIERRHEDSRVGRIRNVTFENINMVSGSGALIQGMPESPIEGLTIRHARLRVARADDYSERRKPVGGKRTTHDERDTLYARMPSYFTIAHARDVTLEDVTVELSPEAQGQYDRSALCARHVDGLRVTGVRRVPGASAEGRPVLDVEGCRSVTMADGPSPSAGRSRGPSRRE